MWAKLEIMPSDRDFLFMPFPIAKDYGKTATVVFGCVCAVTGIRSSGVLGSGEGSSFEKPFRFRISLGLQRRLHIPVSSVYRVLCSEEKIFFGPVIGLLLGTQNHRYTPRHMEKYSDRLGVYDRIGGLVCAFSPKSVNWENNTAYGLFYNIASSAWEYGCFPLPEVIYRRDFHIALPLVHKLSALTDGRLFNSYRFTKYQLFEFVGKDEGLKRYLPPTELSQDFGQISEFLSRYPKAILKPIDLSRGRGIAVIEKENEEYRITDYRNREPKVTEIPDMDALRGFFEVNPGFFSKYLIQQYLQLAKIGDSLFDVRVVMQKQADRKWGCSGIECRVSGGHSHLTNISRGGYALTLDEALRRSFETGYEPVKQEIADFSLKFCSYMDTLPEHFAEFGIDIAVDIHKNLWLIEANVFPSFKGFKRMDMKTYLSIRYTPLLYALSLTRFGSAEQG